jgi:excinuclease UvrABC helicase subunit UvrB
MKPSFANVFNISANENRSEFVLSFFQMYMEHNYTPQKNGLIDCPAKTVDEVSSVLMTRDGAMALIRLLEKTLDLPGADAT